MIRPPQSIGTVVPVVRKIAGAKVIAFPVRKPAALRRAA